MNPIAKLGRSIRSWTAGRKNIGAVVDQQVAPYATYVERHGLPNATRPGTDLKRFVHWAYICTMINAQAVASARLRLYVTRSKGEQKAGLRFGREIAGRTLSRREHERLKARIPTNKRLQTSEDVQEIFDHPFLDVYNHPNPNHSTYDLNELTEGYNSIVGKAYWWMELDQMQGRPTAFWPLRSDFMRVVPASGGRLVKEYIYSTSTSRQHQVSFPVESIAAFRMPNLTNPYFDGLPPHRQSAAVDRYTKYDEYDASLLANNNVPDFLVKYKGQIPHEMRHEIQLQWNQLISSHLSRDRVKVADEDFDIEKLGLTSQELNYIEGRKLTMQEIVALYGVPMSMVTNEGSNRAVSLQGRIQHATNAVTPRLCRMEGTINLDIIPLYDEPRLFVAFDSVVPEDVLLTQKVTTGYVKDGIMTRNEARAELNLPPIEGGDVIYINMNEVPLGTSAAGAQGRETEPKGFRPQHAKLVDTELPGGANPPLTRREKRIVREIENIWEDMSDVVSKVDPNGKFDPSQVKSEVFRERSQRVMRSHISAQAEAGTREAQLQLAEAYGGELPTVRPAQFIERPEVVRAVDNQSLKFAENFTDIAEKDVRNALAEGIKNGERVDQIRDRIKDVFGDKISQRKAEQIARSEMARADSLGRIELWKSESDIITGKAWDAASDACIYCQELNGQIVEVDQPFKNADGGELTEGSEMTVEYTNAENETSTRTLKLNYETIMGPPLHPNCRCVLKPVVVEG
jgi:HK97 family phage portal protein